MKILLCYISGSPDRDDPYISLLPSGLCYLQAGLREAGFDAILANFSAWSDAAIAECLVAEAPELVGISQWTHNRHASMALARITRQVLPGCLVVMGGGHATFCHRDVLGPGTPVDLVVLGEADGVLQELAACRRDGRDWQQVPGIALRRGGRVQLNPSWTVPPDLDRLPFASRYLAHSIGVDQHLQASFIITARGCPSACRFCSSPGFWGRRVTSRAPASVVDEILYLRQTYGLIYFSLRDETFTADRRRTIEFCRLLVERRAYVLWNCQSRVSALDEEVLVWMKRAGCECVQLGVESGSPRILALLGKGITPSQVERAAERVRQVGIHLSVYLISDVPGETEQDIKATLSLMRRIRPDDGYVSPLAYYPGTALFDEAVKEGRVSDRIFESSPEPALYAARRRGTHARRLLAALQSRGGGADRFEQQKRRLGFCATTNVLAGEWYRQEGDAKRAEREYREITEREPQNPWGWYLLAELWSETGNVQAAHRCFRRVLEIVPQHPESRAALGLEKGAHRGGQPA